MAKQKEIHHEYIKKGKDLSKQLKDRKQTLKERLISEWQKERQLR